MLTIPLNRVIAFCKPAINAAAGAAAAWLVAKVNVLGLPGLDQANVATWLAGAIAWGLTHGALTLGDLKWLKGHHILLAKDSATVPLTPLTTAVHIDGKALAAATVPPDEDNGVLQATDGDATQPVAPDPASGSRINAAKEPAPFEETP